MEILCCQLDTAWEDKPASFARARALLESAAPPAGALALLPEMFATGYSMNVAGIAEEPGGETDRFLAETARALGIWVLGGVVTRAPDGRGRNEAVAFAPAGRPAARYAKLHPFSFAGETRHYAPGDRVVTFEWEGVCVAPFVCYDLRFPEAFRAAVRAGAHLFAVIANWPAAREEHWAALLRARAIENQAYVAGCNRCGCDPNAAYSGRSLVFGPRGELLADAGGAEGVIRAAVDLPALLAYRKEFPALADMRGDL